MNIIKKAIEQWTDDKARKYLDRQLPDESVEWIVLDKSGLYGYSDPVGFQYAYADDDEVRAVGITQFLVRNGGTYISNTQLDSKE